MAEVMRPVFREKGLSLNIACEYSRIGIREYLERNRDTDALVLLDRLPSGKLTAEEICYLAEAFTVVCVPLLNTSWRGTEEIVKLYRRGILRAEFYAPPAEKVDWNSMALRIAYDLLNGRDHPSAKAHYGIVDRVI